MRIVRACGVSFMMTVWGLSLISCGMLPASGASKASVSELYQTEFITDELLRIVNDQGYTWVGGWGSTAHDGVSGVRTAESSVLGDRTVRDHAISLFHDSLVDKLDSIGATIVIGKPLELDEFALFGYVYQAGSVRGYVRVVAIVDIDQIVRFTMVVHEYSLSK